MNRDEFLTCSDIPMWAEVLLDAEAYLPDGARGAFIQMVHEERNKLYEARACIVTDESIQFYDLVLTARGGETEREITRWSLPLSAVYVETKRISNDWNGRGEFEDVCTNAIYACL